jgi:hypothetical protein
VPWPPFVAPTLGVRDLTVVGLLERVSTELALPRPDPSRGTAGRVLDTGIEAQVHGPVDLERDVERLVVDPAFAGTHTGACLEELCRRYTIHLDWHVGCRLATRDVPDTFRGPAIAQLARQIAGDGFLDAAVIGAAQASLRRRPDEWRTWGSHDEVQRDLRQLWHTVVHFGAPSASA